MVKHVGAEENTGDLKLQIQKLSLEKIALASKVQALSKELEDVQFELSRKPVNESLSPKDVLGLTDIEYAKFEQKGGCAWLKSTLRFVPTKK